MNPAAGFLPVLPHMQLMTLFPLKCAAAESSRLAWKAADSAGPPTSVALPAGAGAKHAAHGCSRPVACKQR